MLWVHFRNGLLYVTFEKIIPESSGFEVLMNSEKGAKV